MLISNIMAIKEFKEVTEVKLQKQVQLSLLQ